MSGKSKEAEEPSFLNYEMGEGVHAFSTFRAGGCSTGAYASFNVNVWCGDNEVCVARNRELLCRALDLPEGRLVVPHQVHEDKVLCIDEAFLRSGESVRRQRLEGVDAVMTDCPRTCVSVSTADCIPVLLYDESHRAVAAVHAGWRGTVAYIVEKVLCSMSEVYGTVPSAVRAVIGPGISMEAFEVGEEVYEAFANAGFPMQRMAGRYPSIGGTDKEKWHLDLWEANRWQLVKSGVEESSIQMSGICTYARWEDFFSARRLGVRSGRILSGIYLD